MSSSPLGKKALFLYEMLLFRYPLLIFLRNETHSAAK